MRWMINARTNERKGAVSRSMDATRRDALSEEAEGIEGSHPALRLCVIDGQAAMERKVKRTKVTAACAACQARKSRCELLSELGASHCRPSFLSKGLG